MVGKKEYGGPMWTIMRKYLSGGAESFSESIIFGAQVDHHAVQAKADPVPTNHHRSADERETKRKCKTSPNRS